MAFRAKKVIKNITTLFLGNSVAEIIALCSYPFLARLYSPHDFGDMTVLWAYCSSFSAMACWRMESVIVIEKDNSKARKVTEICVFGAYLLVFILALIGVTIFFIPSLNNLITGHLSNLFWALPATVLASGLHLMLTHWAIRQNKYRAISVSRMLAVINSAIVKISYGFHYGSSYIILLISNILSLVVQIIILLPVFINSKPKPGNRSTDEFKFTSIIKEYKAFPTVQLATTFMSTLTFNLPNIFLAIFYSSEIVGYFGFAFALLVRPVTVLADSLAKVLLKEISVSVPVDRVKYGLKMTVAIAILTAPFFVIFAYYAIPIFIFVFGEEWAEAGYYAQLLSIWLYGRLAIIPATQLILVSKLLTYNFWYTLIESISRVALIVIMGWMTFSADTVIAAYAVMGFLLQLIYITGAFAVAKKSYKRANDE